MPLRPERLAVALGLAAAWSAGAAELTTVVTLDNGEFNLPLYTPRWNGKWSSPSAAQEALSSIARVAGGNPHVYTYLPPGPELQPGSAAWRVEPRQDRCVGAAEAQGDPCWCGAGDRCWSGVGANFHRDASTSLYKAVAAVREREHGAGPRIEVHLADLFEEDPSAADDPSKSDNCVTLDGARKAVVGALTLGASESLDHLAVGVLRFDVDAPPPGSIYGHTFALEQSGEGGCWTGRRGLAWEGRRQPFSLAMAVVVVGVDTAPLAAQVDGFLEGLKAQLTAESSALTLVRLREPPTHQRVEATATWPGVGSWTLPRPERVPRVPCTTVVADAALMSGGTPVRLDAVQADCGGVVRLEFTPGTLQKTWLRQAGFGGLDPRPFPLAISGSVQLAAPASDLAAALSALAAVNGEVADRPLPLWDAVPQAMSFQSGQDSPPWLPWQHEIEIASLTVLDLESRPWPLIAAGAAAVALAVALTTGVVLHKVHADRAFQAHWDRAVAASRDPLRQRPLVQVLQAAQEEVRGRWGQRLAIAFLLGSAAALATVWLLVRLHLVRLG